MSRREATVAVPVLRVPLGMQMGGVRLGALADFVPHEKYCIEYTDQQKRIKDEILHWLRILHTRLHNHKFSLQEADFQKELQHLLHLYEEFKATYLPAAAPAPAGKKGTTLQRATAVIRGVPGQ